MDNGKFNVTKNGFYFVSFNSNVDAEQVPISKLTIRVKETNDSFTSNTGINTFTNIDPKPNTNNPHKIGTFLSAGTYQIMIKVEDNWLKYGCASNPVEDFSSNYCSECCNDTGTPKLNPFMDDDSNEECYNCFL